MKKWKRILSAVLAVLLLSGSMPVRAAETVDPDEQAGDIQELKEKLEGLIPEEELGKYTKKEPIGEARVEGETQDRSSFFGSGLPGNDPAGDTSCLWILEYNGI